MIVEPLHPRFIPVLADTFAREWPDWCARVGRPAVEDIFRQGPAGSLPLVLAAHADGDILGTIALRPWFAEEPMAQTPWVRQLYVFPGHRGRGVDRALISELERRAAGLGYRDHLYAATNRIEKLLVRRGWEVFRRVDHEGEPMAWLRKMVPDTII